MGSVKQPLAESLASAYIAAMIPFLKMHGLGNDFAVFDARKIAFAPSQDQWRAIADRRRGIGCDQVIVIAPPQGDGTARMRIVNADGSEVETCGNATRCVARLLIEETGAHEVRIETKGGLKTAHAVQGGLYAVDMGAAITAWDEIPLAAAVDTVRFPLAAKGHSFEVSAVSMGNPHCVVFVDDAEGADVAGLGASLEVHPMFPKRTNVEFVSVLNNKTLRMRVWERGVGITMACGSGACAAAVAAYRRDLAGADVAVVLDGGTLAISQKDGRVWMTGPASLAYEGYLDLGALHP